MPAMPLARHGLEKDRAPFEPPMTASTYLSGKHMTDVEWQKLPALWPEPAVRPMSGSCCCWCSRSMVRQHGRSAAGLN